MDEDERGMKIGISAGGKRMGKGENGGNGIKVKICGLTRECDIDYVNEAMPDYIGFVFAKSRRQVTGAEAERLKRRLAQGIRAVGVFVDEDMERVISLVKNGVVDIVQLHGSETPSYVEALKGRTGCKMIKALHPERGCLEGGYAEKICPDGGLYEEYIRAGADYFLFDSGSRTESGGTGRAFCWDLIPKVSHPYFLAGGLCLENIEAAMWLANPAPYGLDISSGVETDGFKDREKILEIVRRIRNV